MQKLRNILILILLIAFVSACDLQMNPEQQKMEEMIGPQSLTLSSDKMSPEVLWSLGRIGETALSPDKTKLLYGIT